MIPALNVSPTENTERIALIAQTQESIASANPISKVSYLINVSWNTKRVLDHTPPIHNWKIRPDSFPRICTIDNTGFGDRPCNRIPLPMLTLNTLTSISTRTSDLASTHHQLLIR